MFFGRVKGAVGKAIHNILVVEDEPLVAFDNEHALEQAGFRIAATVEDYDHAVAVIDAGGVDLIIADVNLHGEKTGVDLARHARERDLPVLFVTGACPAHARELAVGCLAKPYAPRDLVGAINLVDAVLRGSARPRAPAGFHLFADPR
ncbi:response regulator [Sphingobium sp. AN558]|uniref:response regulator n=1 Tax=Sphingobium sp. AN558 TaxID=3133442 RepID=UPI0030BCD557